MSNIRNNVIEYLTILLLGFWARWIFVHHWLPQTGFTLLIIALSLGKTCWFIFENSQQLIRATAQNLPYHRFLTIMVTNMSQITMSYAIDFYCLYRADAGSFSGIDPALKHYELMFEFGYFSVLNFSFFGYGDITPATIPAKITVLTEIVLAFLTVIFILSDFISLKESLQKRK
ncbi:MAG: hypothetical protein U0X91_14065 [Spirosomataceae bacterium]